MANKLFNTILELIRWPKKELQTYSVGIDLGTTKTSVGYMPLSGTKDVELINFSDNDTDSPLPSVVALERPASTTSNPSVLKVFLGEEILKDNRAFMRDKDSLVLWGIYPRAKLSIGKGEFDRDDFPAALLGKFPEVTPEDIIACILAEVRIAFRKQVKQELIEATITVPASWDPEQRRATKMAAKMAGFSNVVLLEEPVAALIKVVDINQYKGKVANVMVVDFGGGTCDVAIVTIENDEIRLRGAGAQNRLGGELIDEILLDDLINQIKGDKKLLKQYSQRAESKQQYQDNLKDIENNPNTRSLIRRQLEVFKREINPKMASRDGIKFPVEVVSDDAVTKMENTISQLQSGYISSHESHHKEITLGGIIGNYDYQLSFDHFDKLLKVSRLELPENPKSPPDHLSVIDAFDTILLDVLDLFLPSEEKINTVFLVGGSSYLYFVRERIKEKLFADLTLKDASEKIKARTYRIDAVVRGATMYDHQRRHNAVTFKSKLFYNLQLEGDDRSLIKEDLPVDVGGIEVKPALYTLKVSRELPVEKPIRFKLIRSGGTIGKREIIKSLDHNIPIPPDREIQLKFHITSDSIIYIEGKDYISGTEFKSIEAYPVEDHEGLAEKITAFKLRFPKFFHKPKENSV